MGGGGYRRWAATALLLVPGALTVGEIRASTRAAAERWFAAPAVADALLEVIERAVAARAS